ncbi:MAG: M15 family metallopeptidase [Anaerovoracaceae bacterium]|nr:M15 family metallopeptidase [Bacillota bacterium]MDY2670436.1 M15 family metallopeptidase [Anaerovoracaceae bacterium]
MKKRKISRFLTAAMVAVLALVLVTGCGSSGGSHDDNYPSSDSSVSSSETGQKRSSADQKALDQDVADGYLILVNKEAGNHLDASYQPQDLERVKYVAQDRSPAGWSMRHTAAEAFNRLSEDAAKEGIDIVVTTAYRSYDFQTQLFNSYVAQKGEAEANKTSARPGESEHQTGLAADLSTKEINYANSSAYGDTAAGRWTAENCYKYGFIIRFPDGQEGITGYTYEPWHIRYVGMTAAKEIHDQGITLEEYIKENKLGNSIPADAQAGADTETGTGSAQ